MINQLLGTDCSREREFKLIDRCAQTGRGITIPADNAITAGMYKLSSLILASTDVVASQYLLAESERYFAANPDQHISIEEALASSDMIGLSRFSTKLRAELKVDSLITTPIKTHLDFEDLLANLFIRLENKVGLERKVKAYLSGDAAAYFYTRNFLRPRIQVEFEERFLRPDTIFSVVELEDRRAQLLYFDVNYNANFQFLHDHYRSDSIKMDLGLSMIDLYILNPVDLAVSKVLNLSKSDQSDVANIIRQGLASREEIEVRGLEAMNSLIYKQSGMRESYLKALGDL